MPYARPTLTDLIGEVNGDIQTGLEGTDPLLRFSALQILGMALAALANEQYGYTDYVAQQAVPFTATGEYLAGWAALKKVFREAATQAGAATPGQITFPAANATPALQIPIGTTITRGDGVQYVATALATASGGSIVVSAEAVADPAGLTGAFGNCAAGTLMTLGTSIPGITSTGPVTTAFTGGADIEDDDSLRSRMLAEYQNPPQGGSVSDYVEWALEVNGVTRAWCNPNGFGAGTVVVYSMLDVTEVANNGFPQGVSGVATLETRGIPTATLDLLNIANWIYPLRPATALVYSVAPTPDTINFAISGTGNFSAATRALISSAIAGVFVMYGSPLGTTAGQNGEIDLSYINSAIAAISGTQGFVITSPTSNIVGATGQLPVLGTIAWDA